MLINRLSEFLFSPTYQISLLLKIMYFLRDKKIKMIPYIISYRIFKRFNCDISVNAKIRRNLRLPHPIGIVIGNKSIIGDNVTIFQNVTLGSAGKGGGKVYPQIMDGVIIYAGAKLIGNIKVGNNAVIGANAVVSKDVPENSIAVGVPAIIKFPNEK